MLRLVIRICQLVLHTSFVCDIRARRVWHNFHFHRSRRREAQRELCTFAFIEGAFAENLAELDDTLMIFNNFAIKT